MLSRKQVQVAPKNKKSYLNLAFASFVSFASFAWAAKAQGAGDLCLCGPSKGASSSVRTKANAPLLGLATCAFAAQAKEQVRQYEPRFAKRKRHKAQVGHAILPKFVTGEKSKKFNKRSHMLHSRFNRLLTQTEIFVVPYKSAFTGNLCLVPLQPTQRSIRLRGLSKGSKAARSSVRMKGKLQGRPKGQLLQMKSIRNLHTQDFLSKKNKMHIQEKVSTFFPTKKAFYQYWVFPFVGFAGYLYLAKFNSNLTWFAGLTAGHSRTHSGSEVWTFAPLLGLAKQVRQYEPQRHKALDKVTNFDADKTSSLEQSLISKQKCKGERSTLNPPNKFLGVLATELPKKIAFYTSGYKKSQVAFLKSTNVSMAQYMSSYHFLQKQEKKSILNFPGTLCVNRFSVRTAEPEQTSTKQFNLIYNQLVSLESNDSISVQESENSDLLKNVKLILNLSGATGLNKGQFAFLSNDVYNNPKLAPVLPLLGPQRHKGQRRMLRKSPAPCAFAAQAKEAQSGAVSQSDNLSTHSVLFAQHSLLLKQKGQNKCTMPMCFSILKRNEFLIHQPKQFFTDTQNIYTGNTFLTQNIYNPRCSVAPIRVFAVTDEISLSPGQTSLQSQVNLKFLNSQVFLSNQFQFLNKTISAGLGLLSSPVMESLLTFKNQKTYFLNLNQSLSTTVWQSNTVSNINHHNEAKETKDGSQRTVLTVLTNFEKNEHSQSYILVSKKQNEFRSNGSGSNKLFKRKQEKIFRSYLSRKFHMKNKKLYSFSNQLALEKTLKSLSGSTLNPNLKFKLLEVKKQFKVDKQTKSLLNQSTFPCGVYYPPTQQPMSPNNMLRRIAFFFKYQKEGIGKETTSRIEKQRLLQKKRRRKKQKRFYPRPVWLRFFLYKNFLTQRHFPSLLNSLGFAYPCPCKFARINQYKPLQRCLTHNKLKIHSFKIKKGGVILLAPYANTPKKFLGVLKYSLLRQQKKGSFGSLGTRKLESQKIWKNQTFVNKIFRNNKTQLANRVKDVSDMVLSPCAFVSLRPKQRKQKNMSVEQNQELFNLRQVSFQSSMFNRHDYYQISNKVMSDFQRLCWKSYWLRSSLTPYIDRIQNSLGQMHKIEKIWQSDEPVQTKVTLNSYLNSFTFMAGLNSGTTRFGSQDILIHNPNKPFKVKTRTKDSKLNFQDFQKKVEYERVLYERISDIIENVKANLDGSGQNRPNSFKVGRSRKENLSLRCPFAMSSSRSGSSRNKNLNLQGENDFWYRFGLFLNNGLNVPTIQAFSLGSSLESSVKPFGDLPTLRTLWALNKTNKMSLEISQFGQLNETKTLWSVSKFRDQNASNKTKKFLSTAWKKLVLNPAMYPNLKTQEKVSLYKLEVVDKKLNSLGTQLKTNKSIFKSLKMKLKSSRHSNFVHTNQMNLQLDLLKDKASNDVQPQKQAKRSIHFWWLFPEDKNAIYSQTFVDGFSLFSTQVGLSKNVFGQATSAFTWDPKAQETLLTTLWGLTLLFHVCSLFSFIQIPEIRSLTKFYILILYKLSNTYLILIYAIFNLLANYVKQLNSVFTLIHKSSKVKFQFNRNRFYKSPSILFYGVTPPLKYTAETSLLKVQTFTYKNQQQKNHASLLQINQKPNSMNYKIQYFKNKNLPGRASLSVVRTDEPVQTNSILSFENTSRNFANYLGLAAFCVRSRLAQHSPLRLVPLWFVLTNLLRQPKQRKQRSKGECSFAWTAKGERSALDTPHKFKKKLLGVLAQGASRAQLNSSNNYLNLKSINLLEMFFYLPNTQTSKRNKGRMLLQRKNSRFQSSEQKADFSLLKEFSTSSDASKVLSVRKNFVFSSRKNFKNFVYSFFYFGMKFTASFKFSKPSTNQTSLYEIQNSSKNLLGKLKKGPSFDKELSLLNKKLSFAIQAHFHDFYSLLWLGLLTMTKASGSLMYNSIGFGSFVLFKIVDMLESLMLLIYKFLEKPAEFMIEWIAQLFLVEWSSDIITFIPESFDIYTWRSFTKLSRGSRIFSVFGFLFQRRLWCFFEIFMNLLTKSDSDLVTRQKKGIIFWDVWAEILMSAAEKYRINLSSLTTVKEEQEAFLERLLNDPQWLSSWQFSGLASRAFFASRNAIRPYERHLHSKGQKEASWSVQTNNVSKTKSQNAEFLAQKPPFKIEKQTRALAELEFLATAGNCPESLEGRTSFFYAQAYQNKTVWENLNSWTQYLTRLNSSQTLNMTNCYFNPGHILFSDTSLFNWSKVNLSSFYDLRNRNLNKPSYGPVQIPLNNSSLFHFLDKKESFYFVSDFYQNWKVWQRWSANQHFSSQGTDTELFIDVHPPKSFADITSLKASHSGISGGIAGLPTLGTLTCQIYSGLFSKQIAKNILVVGSPGNNQSQLIQALAGETELKMIADNAHRYAHIQRGIAVGMKLLRDVFDGLALHTPCLFLMEDIHVIGERRPMLISDNENAKAAESQFTSENDEVHEKNQFIYQLNKHAISDYRKPYKGDFSLLIPTNHFCFDLFLGVSPPKIRKNNRTPRSPFSLETQFFETQKDGTAATENKQPSTLVYKSLLQISSHQFFAPPATSPFTILGIKEQRQFKSKQLVKEITWGGLSNDQLMLLPKVAYSIRVKIALLADFAMNQLSVKLDMITDLLVIMDNVRSNRGFVVFATTHVPFVLDPALRRPGRLDETISLPFSASFIDRFEILKTSLTNYVSTLDFVNYSFLLRNYNERDLSTLISRTKLLLFNTQQFYSNQSLFDQDGALAFSAGNNSYSAKSLNTNLGLQLKAFRKTSLDQTVLYSLTQGLSLMTQAEITESKKLYRRLKKAQHRNISTFVLSKVGPANLSFDGTNQSVQTEKTQEQKSLLELLKTPSATLMSSDNLKSRIFQINVKHDPFQAEFSKEVFPQTTSQLKVLIPETLMSVVYSYISKFIIQSQILFDTQSFRSIFTSVEESFNEREHGIFRNLYSSSTDIQNILMFFIAGKAGEYFFFSQQNRPSRKVGQYFNDNKSKSQVKQVRQYEQNLVNTLLLKPALTNPQLNSGLWNVSNTLGPTFLSQNTRMEEFWSSATSFVFALVQKRYLYHKTLLTTRLLYFHDISMLREPPSPPGSTILIVGKKYENFKRTERDFQEKSVYSILEKIQLHQQQRFMKKLYEQPVSDIFRSEMVQNRYTSFNTSVKELGYYDEFMRKPTSVNLFYKNRLLTRHKFSLINQWWNGQLAEQNLEATFSSDVDWRSMFVESFGDLVIDFPDADQHYNPKLRRWFLQSTYGGYWNSFEKAIPFEIYQHYIIVCFNKVLNYLETEREILDSLAYSYLQKGSFKELDFISNLTRFEVSTKQNQLNFKM